VALLAMRQKLGADEGERNSVRSFLADPKAFNYLIMVLYALNAARWAYERKLADTCYWLSALAITLTVTFLYEH
jgi:hypothetical protein